MTATIGSATFAGLRRAARTRPGQALLKRPLVQRVASVFLESTTLRGSLRFVARELGGRDILARYELRSSGLPVYLRHQTEDRFVLHEVFYCRHYDLPEPVERFLTQLGRPPEIIDLGANIGLFGVLMRARFPGATITAFEPDSTNAELHRLAMAASNVGNDWKLVEAAASNRDGIVPFRSGEFARSRIETDGATEQVDAVDVFPLLEHADLAKIDIEGGEWAILGDERFARLQTPVLVLEYHPDLSPTDDPRAAAFDAMSGAGYRTLAIREFARDHGMLWAWKPLIEA